MINSQYPTARISGLVIQEMPDEVLVYDLDNNKAHCLNESAAFVWRTCDGTNSVSDIVRQFESTSRGAVTEDFVWLAIDQLKENGLLEAGVESRFAGRSRRDILKKIGLASLVALPVIASLVTPQSVMAASSCACVVGPPASCIGRGCPSNTCNPVGAICAP